MAIQWEDPPKVNEPKSTDKWAAEALEFQAHPKRWGVLDSAEVGESRKRQQALHAQASSIRQGRFRAFRPVGAWEAKTVTVKGVTKLFARYIGEKS
jgi:hypothetical protein